MNVDRIMTRGTITIGMDDGIYRVKDLFAEHAFHHLLVIDNEQLVGVISDRDLLRNVSPFIGKLSERTEDTATLNRRVHQIMTRKPITISPETDVRDASRVILDHGVSCLPVVTDDGRVAGIVTWRDLLGGLCEIMAGVGPDGGN